MYNDIIYITYNFSMALNEPQFHLHKARAVAPQLVSSAHIAYCTFEQLFAQCSIHICSLSIVIYIGSSCLCL